MSTCADPRFPECVDNHALTLAAGCNLVGFLQECNPGKILGKEEEGSDFLLLGFGIVLLCLHERLRALLIDYWQLSDASLQVAATTRFRVCLAGDFV